MPADVDVITNPKIAPAPTTPAAGSGKTWSVSRGELERRWSLLREHLREQGLQALVVQGYEEKVGGYIRWLTDVPPGYPRFVVFHLDDHMTLVDHGPQGEVRLLDDKDPNRPGIGELVTNWALVGGHFTHGLGAESVAGVLKRRSYTRVGLVGPGAMPHGFVAGLTALMGDAVEFSDVTDFVDTAKADKSPEEIQMIRRVAETQDLVFDKLIEWIRPGVRDFEVNAFMDYQLQLLGADRGVYIAVSAPIGTPAPFGYRAVQGRTMNRGDHMNVLLESNGLGGVWTELGRMVAFGALPDAVHEAHQVCVEAQAYSASLSVPGADPAEIFANFNDFMVARGAAPEKRLYSHGQGYDTVERPLIRPDETMKLPAHVNLAIHPTFAKGSAFATLCDGFIVGDGGGFIHSTPKKPYEL